VSAAPPTVSVGLRIPHALFEEEPSALRSALARAEAAGLDRVTTGDHVSFQGGQGFDGLLQVAAMAALTSTITVQTAVYLIGLRHPVPVARQVATIGRMAPGRFIFGVGLGGEDRHEWELCGVDPSTRGRRVDESLTIVRGLLTGERVDHHGSIFELEDARILPVPAEPVPIVIGGRSDAALRRTALLGDGWLGLFLSADRYRDATVQVEQIADDAGRTGVTWRHAMHLWCGFGPSSAPLAAAMEALYKIPYDRFERYAPSGTPADVAEYAQAYVDAGCRHINVGPVADTFEETVDGAAEVKRLLNARAAAAQPA
jgi:alkanesulfonate monooxygenase SsuD/methylene tetrahydromethanopterin reductase-like flavin-dependent oxidoreductase (luciferase family)